MLPAFVSGRVSSCGTIHFLRLFAEAKLELAEVRSSGLDDDCCPDS